MIDTHYLTLVTLDTILLLSVVAGYRQCGAIKRRADYMVALVVFTSFWLPMVQAVWLPFLIFALLILPQSVSQWMAEPLSPAEQEPFSWVGRSPLPWIVVGALLGGTYIYFLMPYMKA